MKKYESLPNKKKKIAKFVMLILKNILKLESRQILIIWAYVEDSNGQIAVMWQLIATTK